MTGPNHSLPIDCANPWNRTSPLTRRFRGFWTCLPGLESGAVIPELVNWGTRRGDVSLASVSNAAGATSGLRPANRIYPFPSLQLPGSTSYAVQSADDGIGKITKAVCCCAWVYVIPDSNQRTALAKFNQSGQRQYMLDITTSNNLRFIYSRDGSNSTTLNSASAVSTGWYFFAGTYTNDGVSRLYIGTPGQRVTLNNSGTGTAGDLFDGSAPISIGAMSNASGAFFWNGNVGACGVMGSIPSEDELNAIAQDGWRGFPLMLNRVGRRIKAGTTAYTLTAAKGTFTETGNAALLKATFKLTAAAGAFTETGNAATLRPGLKLSAAAGSFTEAGNAALLKATFKLTCAAGAVNEVGNAAALKGTFKLTCAAGSFLETGNAAGLRGGNTLVAAKGTFSETGQPATLKGAFKLSAAQGTFAETGNDASLVVPNSFVLQANAGTFSQTGQAASLKAARKTVASAGAISLTANAATLKALRRLTGANASFALSSQAASLVYSGELFAGPGIAVDLPYRPSAVDLPVRLTAVDLVSR